MTPPPFTVAAPTTVPVPPSVPPLIVVRPACNVPFTTTVPPLVIVPAPLATENVVPAPTWMVPLLVIAAGVTEIVPPVVCRRPVPALVNGPTGLIVTVPAVARTVPWFVNEPDGTTTIAPDPMLSMTPVFVTDRFTPSGDPPPLLP